LARPDEIATLAAVLADAFDDDPLMRYVVPAKGYRERLTSLFIIELRLMAKLDATWVECDDAGPTGVAIWAPPGRWKQRPVDQIRTLPRALCVFGRGIGRSLSLLGAIEKVHPRTPAHWYLGTIGTATAHRGRGVGGRLLRTILDRCDAEQLPAYLESSKPENVPYYERFGFSARPTLTMGVDAPPVIPMWRDPQLPE
jgi:GNAT superfamily N-acetyltransferase